jgi:hypothetical protein
MYRSWLAVALRQSPSFGPAAQRSTPVEVVKSLERILPALIGQAEGAQFAFGAGTMAKEAKTLDDLFHDTLKDIYFAEKKILGALPKMAKAAQNGDLKAAFEKHRDQTEEHVFPSGTGLRSDRREASRQRVPGDHGHHR